MTRESLKAYLMQITQADKDSLASRWNPELLCEMIDNMTDDDILGLLNIERTCENCKLFRELDKACFLNSYNAYVRPSSIDFSGCGKWEAR